MKKLYAFLICAFMLYVSGARAIDANTSVLSDGRWYNDEFSLDIAGDGSYTAYYTFGGRTGSMKGTITYKDGEDYFILKKGATRDAFDTSFIPSDGLKLYVVEDGMNPKSTRFIRNENGTFILWNKNYMVKENQQATVDNIPVVTMGYKLSATTANLKIRKGPGKDYENMQFYYKDKKTGEIKSWGSILEGTNIRILARTKDKQKVDKWNNYWYYIEYKEPEGSLMVYRNAWCFAEFIKDSGDAKHKVAVKTPKNEQSYYDYTDVNIVFEGTVTGDPNSFIVQVKSSDGTVLAEGPVDYSKGKFKWNTSDLADSLNYGSNTFNFVAEYTDGKTASAQITIYIHEPDGEMGKPVIYLYPEKEMNVKVKVKPANGISKSEPEYGKGWDVTAKPDGTIINKADGKTYPYLFWEAPEDDAATFSEGFVVKTDDLPEFFDGKLAYMGMNAKEINDFKEFWIPLLSKGKYYCIRFYSQEEMDKAAPLEVKPKPDTVIRIYFESKPLDKPVEIKKQKLKKGSARKGFTVIEWGGRRN